MRRCIAVLEDNERRIEMMGQCLADKFPFFDYAFFRSAPEITDWLKHHSAEVICLSLDHDLEPPAERPGFDPGSAREVVHSFMDGPQSFPIVLHTTNVPAAIAMQAELDDRGWSVQRITPYGDLEWIAESWLPTVRRAVVDQAEPAVRPADTARTG